MARRPLAIFGLYVALSAVATWPLPRDMASRIASDPGDPILNTSILLWNATTLPFSRTWWNAPHFYPADGVSSFTENLLGLSPIASPVYWLTGNPILAYNLTLFLTWPLSAWAAYMLVRFMTAREDAAFLAGLSFGFTPYRAVGLGHIQTLACFGVPLFLLGLHGYLQTRRWPWLLLFAAAWLQQSLANGYFILYGGLLIALWLVYFCSRRGDWQAGLSIATAWAIASVPLAPMLFVYRQIHERFGLHRTLNEILYFSASAGSWFESTGDVWLWGAVFPAGKDNLFPGATALMLSLAGVGGLLLRRRDIGGDKSSAPRWVRLALTVATAISLIAVLIGLSVGPVDTTVASLPVRMRDLNRALALLLISGIPLVLFTAPLRDALLRRSLLVFYAGAAILIAVLCFGPVLRVGEHVMLSTAPYKLLLALPGFGELRVPTQLKMIGILCLSVTAALAYLRLRPVGRRSAATLFAAVAFGLLLDGGMTEVRMADAPALWSQVETPDRLEPILELPIGPDWDFAATLRAASHHRRVLNGVSGYNPPHYVALVAGLQARDPSMLGAIASLGSFEIVVNRSDDPTGALARYAASAPGALIVADDGSRIVYRVPGVAAEPPLGDSLPIARVEAVRHPNDWRLMHDGRMETGWGDYPQKPDAWILIDLGAAREVGGVTHFIGDYLLDFPRQLVIDASVDGQSWEPVWNGSAAAPTFLAYVREPRLAGLRFAFAPRPARFIRLRQLENYPSMWRVSELNVHTPSRQGR